jgi:hypothetical protein
VQSLAAAQLGIFSELVEIVDDDPLLFLQWANAAETAQDYESAITAYESFLELNERGQRRAVQAHRLQGDHRRPGRRRGPGHGRATARRR